MTEEETEMENEEEAVEEEAETEVIEVEDEYVRVNFLKNVEFVRPYRDSFCSLFLFQLLHFR